MKQTSTTAMPVITDDDAPQLTQEHFNRAKFRVANTPVNQQEWQLAVNEHVGKEHVDLMLDVPIIEHFKAMAGERGYQTLINDTLREAMRGQHIEELLRRVIREEMHLG